MQKIIRVALGRAMPDPRNAGAPAGQIEPPRLVFALPCPILEVIRRPPLFFRKFDFTGRLRILGGEFAR